MSQRIEKLQKLAKLVLGEEIARLKDPRIGFVTITTVRMSRDLSYASIYVTVMGTDEEKVATFAGLKSASPHLRKILGQQMHTRLVPELRFLEDNVMENVNRIEELFQRIHEQEESSQE
jgi:ribosome-binding factor A